MAINLASATMVLNPEPVAVLDSRQDLRRHDSGVLRAVDGHAGNRNTRGHLHDGKQGIQPAQILGLNGDADNRQVGQ